MEFFKPGRVIDFMRVRRPVITGSAIAVVLSLASFVWPGANFGIDFRGGTELELRFDASVTAAQVRSALEASGYAAPDVVNVEGHPGQYIIRVREVSAIDEGRASAIERAVRQALGEVRLENFSISPGGDKITVRLGASVEADALRNAVEQAGVRVRGANAFGRPEDHRYEIHLAGVAERILEQLRQRLGEKAPSEPLRVEWMGPKAGAQLRDAAIQAILYALAFIMVYVAFRFDLRFAPGGVVALLHDAIVTLGVYNALQKEVNLTTVAAVLTVVGYSINDTIVVYDRIRENMTRMRDRPLRELINLSVSQTLSRSIITSGTTLLSMAAFFFFGTDVIRDLTFAIFVGILVGTYSSIYVAAPLTELMDHYLFRRRAALARKAPSAGRSVPSTG